MDKHFYTYPTVIEIRPEHDPRIAGLGVSQRPESRVMDRADLAAARPARPEPRSSERAER